MFRQGLIFAGFDVVEAGDGLEALRTVDSTTPDAVILDLGLPIVDGQTVRQEIAAHAHTRQIPVIIVTGQAPPGAGLASISRKSWAGTRPREVSWWAVAKPAWPAPMMMLR